MSDQQEKRFYVYLLKCEDDSYYVGKGQGGRWLYSKRERGGIELHFQYFVDSEEEAFRVEDKISVEMVRRGYELRNKCRPGRYGQRDQRSNWHHTEEAKLKISVLRKQHWAGLTTEQKALWIKNAKEGRAKVIYRHSEETKEIIRQANLGHKVSAETRAKISAKNKGRMKGFKHSAESIAKMRESRRRLLADSVRRKKCSDKLSENNYKVWASYTPEQRNARGLKVKEGMRKVKERHLVETNEGVD